MSTSPHLVSEDWGSWGWGPEWTISPLLLVLEEECKVGQGSLGMGVFPPVPPHPGCLPGSRPSVGPPGLSALGVCLIMTFGLSLEVTLPRSAGSPAVSPTSSSSVVAFILFYCSREIEGLEKTSCFLIFFFFKI